MKNPFDFYTEEILKKDKYTIRMEITLDRKMTQEEAEKRIFGALRGIGMKAHKGGVE